MRITLTSKLVNSQANEGSAFTLTANFFDDTSDVWSASAPTSARYRIDRVNGDPSCSQTILDWTTLSPATSNSIVITGAQNEIQDNCAHVEGRQITIQANTGLSTQFEETYSYRVKNLAGVM